MQKKQTWRIDVLFLAIFIGSLYFLFLGARPLFVPDEGRYAEIAREMVMRHDYVTPYLNGIKYFEKPILFYWLGSAAIKIGGLHVFALRTINALLGLIGVLFTYFTARKLYDRLTGLLAGVILGTSTLYFIMSHMINLDLTVTVFISASLYAFILGTRQPSNSKTQGVYFILTAMFAALAVLTKGLIGIVFPGIIITIWICLTKQWRLLKSAYLPICILIFFLIAAPWHFIVNQRNPEFFYFYFIEQHFLRYTTAGVGHYQPFWFFIPSLIAGFFPWIIFLPQAIKSSLQGIRKKPVELFWLLTTTVIFIFFSLSQSKLIPYILPVFPPLAILTAHYVATAIQSNNDSLKISVTCLLLLSLLIAATLIAFPASTLLPNQKMAQHFLTLASIALVIGAGIACLFAYMKDNRLAITTIALTAYCFLMMIILAAPAIDTRSILPLAQAMRSTLNKDDEVITYNQYYQDLPFYLERQVSILNWQNEMSYGMQHQDTRAWMINDREFWRRWRSHQRVLVVISRDELKLLQKQFPHEKFHVFAESINNVVIVNHTHE